MRKPTAIGLLIRQRREKLRLSRSALGRIAHLSESTIKNIESGQHMPMRSTLAELAVALDLPGLVEPASAVVTLLDSTEPEALAALLKNYSVQTLTEALRLAQINLWVLFSTLFPVSAGAAETMARVDVAALAAEHSGPSA